MENNNEFDSKIQDVKEIVELSSDEIENNEKITATLDLEDLKSLKFLYEESLKMRKELDDLSLCFDKIQAQIIENITDANEVRVKGNYLGNFSGSPENQSFYYDGVFDASLFIQGILDEYKNIENDENN